MLRESGDFSNVEMRQSIIIDNGSSICNDNNHDVSADILRPLDNVFIDIKLKSTCSSSQYLTKSNNNNNNMTTSIRHNTINYNNISNGNGNINKINNL